MLEIRLCRPLDTVFFLITNREDAEKIGAPKENQMTLFAKNGTKPRANGLMRRMVVALGMAALFFVATAEPAPRFYFNTKAGRLNKKTPITIICQNDFSGTKEELQILLQQSGFQIYSAIAAKSTATGQGASYKTVEQGVGYGSINTLDQSQREYTQENQNYVRQTYQRYGTENLITLRYLMSTDKKGNIFVDKNGHMFFASFSAEIASKETGAIMMSIQYPYYAEGYEKTELLNDMVARMRLCAERGWCDEKSQTPTKSKDDSIFWGVVLAIICTLGLLMITVGTED